MTDAVSHSLTTRWCDLFCDIIPANGGKDLGVAATLERLGIDASEAIAFGDGENDLSMFSAVGTSVAMGNAGDREGRGDLRDDRRGRRWDLQRRKALWTDVTAGRHPAPGTLLEKRPHFVFVPRVL
ncbi:MAG: HAD hydrolase family protein [Collinsella sp.]